MPRTRKYGKRSRVTRRHRRRGGMKGGGKLDRLPIGPGSRNADGNPIQVRIPGEAIVGGAGAAHAPKLYPLGSSDLYGKSVGLAKSRLEYLHEKPDAWTNEQYLKHLGVMSRDQLRKNTQRTYLTPSNYNTARNAIEGLAMSVGATAEQIEIMKKQLEPSDAIVKTLKDDLATNWEFKYVCGHGVLAPDKLPIRVPERTYIRFNSPTGCLAIASSAIPGVLPPMLPFSETFIHMKGTRAEEKAAFIDAFAEHYLNNTGPLESFSSPEERASVLATPFPANFCKSANVFEESTNAKCLTDIQKKQTIYMPGETISEMNISFKNNPNQFLLLGVYDLPIDSSFYQTIAQEASVILGQIEVGARAPLTPAEQLGLDVEYFKNDSFNSGGVIIQNPNLNKGLIGEKVLLSRVLTDLGPVPAGQVRFLFINSCRGVPVIRNDHGLRRENVLRAWHAGAGGAAAPPSFISPDQRHYLARLQRKASLGSEENIEKIIQVAELAEIMKWLKTHPDDGSEEYRSKKAIESAAFERTQRPPFTDETYFLARSLVDE